MTEATNRIPVRTGFGRKCQTLCWIVAAAGTRFEQFYSGCAVCSPSRATLMTGRHRIRTGVYSWIHDASQKFHLRLRETTLAGFLTGTT